MSRRWLWYTLGHLYDGLFAIRPHRDLVQHVAKLIAPEGRMLDAGCGTGMLEEYAENNSNITAVDFSKSMLARARRRFERARQADVSNLPFKSNTFAQVVSINVLYAAPNQAMVVEEMVRVLQPSGQLILANPVISALTPLLSEHFRVASLRENIRLAWNLPRIGAWVIVRLVQRSEFRFLPEPELRKLIEAAGLTIQTCEPCYAGIGRLIIATKEKESRLPKRHEHY